MEDYRTLPQLGRYVQHTYSNPHAFNFRRGRIWQNVSHEQWFDGLRRLTLGLHALGVKPGDAIGLIGPSSPQWLLIDLAISSAGALSVPMFARLSPENFEYEVNDAKIKRLFVFGTQRYRTVLKRNVEFETIITADVKHKEEKPANHLTLDEVMQMGETLGEQQPDLYERLRDTVQADDLATIIYTSGSTGTPKGVELTHANLISQVKSSCERFNIDHTRDRAVTALPLAHVFERMVIYFFLASGVPTYFVEDIKEIGAAYKMHRPTIGTVVPRLLERVHGKMQNSVNTATGLKGMIARWGFKLAASGPLTGFKALLKPLADKLVFSKFREATGGCFEIIISGGAALAPDLCQFFWNIGIPVYQGYGLTETSPVIATNGPGRNRIGTVGQVYPDIDVKIGANDEILCRGPNVMRGYHNHPEMTAESIDADGWFHTGDCGHLDADGYLTITGRIKEIQKTSGGKMVTPVPIEHELCSNELVDQALVIAEGRKYVTALLIPDFEELHRLRDQLGLKTEPDHAILETQEVRKSLDRTLRGVNAGLAAWEKVRRTRWVSQPLSIDKGELTPTLKIRRKAVQERYSDLIETMYEE